MDQSRLRVPIPSSSSRNISCWVTYEGLFSENMHTSQLTLSNTKSSSCIKTLIYDLHAACILFNLATLAF